tara:strand:+ start:1383 stop:1625 length:243 start_codon:yes stop_codon:yes gene_type:complete
MPQINNADGTVLDTSWPSQDKPVMLNDARDEEAQADKEALAAFKATHGQLKSYSYIGKPMFDGRIRRKNNVTGEIEIVDV